MLDGKTVRAAGVAPTTTLLQFLRDGLGRTGTKEGCAEGDCGACTVVVGELAGRADPLPRGQFLHPLSADARRQGSRHRREPQGARRHAASGAARDGRLPRIAVRLLHAGLRDVAVRPVPEPGAGRARRGGIARWPETCAAAPATGPIIDAGRRMYDYPPPRSLEPRGRAEPRAARAPAGAASASAASRSTRRPGFHAPQQRRRARAAVRRATRMRCCSPAAPTSGCGSPSSCASCRR